MENTKYGLWAFLIGFIGSRLFQFVPLTDMNSLSHKVTFLFEVILTIVGVGLAIFSLMKDSKRLWKILAIVTLISGVFSLLVLLAATSAGFPV